MKGETGGILRAGSVVFGFAKTIIWGNDFAKPRSLIFWGVLGRIGKKKKGSGENEFLPILLFGARGANLMNTFMRLE